MFTIYIILTSLINWFFFKNYEPFSVLFFAMAIRLFSAKERKELFYTKPWEKIVHQSTLLDLLDELSVLVALGIDLFDWKNSLTDNLLLAVLLFFIYRFFVFGTYYLMNRAGWFNDT